MSNKEIEVLKLISKANNSNYLEDFTSLEKEGYSSGFLESMKTKGLIFHGGAHEFHLTKEGERILRESETLSELKKFNEQNSIKINSFSEPQLFVFTAGSLQAYQHYVDTIEEGFDLDKIQEFLTEKQKDALKVIYGKEKIRAWGAVPGSQNIKNWEKMQIGDRVLIYRKGNYEYYATVSFKIHNKNIAKKLWKTNEYSSNDETWEYIYFLEDLTEISVPVKEFNNLVGYLDNYFPQGFGTISKEKIEDINKNFISIEGFLKSLEEGKWVEKSENFSQEVKNEIRKEKFSSSIKKTNLLEANLENFLADRVEQIEEGMKLVSRQLDTRVVGRLDLLCEDKEGTLVVVELKKMKAGPSIIDQIQRYMGWIMENKAKPNQKVRGIIIVGKKDTALEYAVKANPLIEVKVFSINFN